MTKRIEKLKKMQRAERASVSIERLVFATEAYKKYAGERGRSGICRNRGSRGRNVTVSEPDSYEYMQIDKEILYD